MGKENISQHLVMKGKQGERFMGKENIGQHLVMKNFTENLQSIFHGAKTASKIL